MQDIDETTCRVSVENLENLFSIWHDRRGGLDWTCPFVLPPWLSAWWSVFGEGEEILIATVRQHDAIIGIAPLMVQGRRLLFLGSPDVCDYFDCVTAPGKEPLFLRTLLDYLAAQGLVHFNLGPVRPESCLLKAMSGIGLDNGSQCRIEQEDVILEFDLPPTWQGFLDALGGKERHEVRRKLRRLEESGRVVFRMVDDVDEVPHSLETFIRLFVMNRADKAGFMTGRMISFFKSLSLSLAEEGLLRLYFLEVNGKPAASVFCFDHQGTRFLYNNAYDGAYRGTSVGLMSKVLSIKAAIDTGLRRYSFLKGGEAYKYRLGGKEVPLLHCVFTAH